MTDKEIAQSNSQSEVSLQPGGNDSSPKEKFMRRIAGRGGLAAHMKITKDYDKATQISLDCFNALGVNNGLQSMVAAQMLSIHELQQEVMMYANVIEDIPSKQYFVNSAVKLSNCFTQQATLLAKLQGQLVQTMTVERVDVHNGGQAVVGSVGGLNQTDKAQK